MKVRFAVQVFSSSVANALQMCRNVLHLENFQQSKATEDFLYMMNDLFDIFNSRNLRQKFYKCPINPNNHEVILSYFKEIGRLQTMFVKFKTKKWTITNKFWPKNWILRFFNKYRKFKNVI